LLAQDEKESEIEKEKGFQMDRLFTGGSVSLGFSNYQTVLGLSPYFGYSLTKWLDAAVSVGFTYTSQRDIIYVGDKARQTVVGPGAFIRIFPLKFLFAHAQYEHNFIRVRYMPGNGINETYHINAPSYLVGGGYAGGRDEGNTFYYFSILWDIGDDVNSPYKDNLNRSVPIVKAGYNIALFEGRRKRN
jgi:hypothetical protein